MAQLFVQDDGLLEEVEGDDGRCPECGLQLCDECGECHDYDCSEYEDPVDECEIEE